MNKEKFKGIVIGVVLTVIVGLSVNPSYAKTIIKQIKVYYPGVKISVNNKEIAPKDANGKTVEPFIHKGSTFLPVRAISEALNKDVKWDENTKTVIINDKNNIESPQKSKSIGPSEFLLKYTVKDQADFTIGPGGSVTINGKEISYNNKIFGKENFKANYKLNKEFTKLTGTLLTSDTSEGMYGDKLILKSDGKIIFNGGEFLKTKGFKEGSIPVGSKNQPVEFEVDLTGVDDLEIDLGYFATVYNLRFIY